MLARIAFATNTMNRARTALRAAEHTLAETDAEQKRVAAQADDLELRIKVIQDAMPISPAGAADPAREQARLSAARSLALDAKLLCAGARMVGSDNPALTKAQTSVDDLEKRITDKPRPAPIEAAMRARAECLAALTAARRPATQASSLGKSDELLSEISAMGGLALPQLPLIKGDARCVSIAAASIIAKVTRDRLLVAAGAAYPGYGFAAHKGYSTPEHRQALHKLGPSAVHRKSFPVMHELQGEYSPLFYVLKTQLEAARTRLALDELETALRVQAAELAEQECKKLKLLVARRWKFIANGAAHR